MNYKKNLRIAIFIAMFWYPILWSSIGYGASVQGVIHYNGTQTDTIIVAALNQPDLSAVICQTSLSTPGPYTLTCPPGNYYFVAQLDLDGSGSLSSDNPLEPFDAYSTPEMVEIVILGDETLQGIDLYLSDIKEGCIVNSGYAADYFTDPSHSPQDMAYYNGYLWICDSASWQDQGLDLYKVIPTNGHLVESINLGIPNVYSLEWIGNDLWVCYIDNDRISWKLKKFSYTGTSFLPGVTIQLPSSTDWNVIWSLNIAWDGYLMWVQEKGKNGNVYKINLINGTIEETITCNTFEGTKDIGDISDICFSNGLLWGMDDDNPVVVQIDPVTFEQHLTYFEVDQQYFGENGKYTGMVKEGENVYFFQRNSEGPYKIYVGSLCNEKVSCDVNGDGKIGLEEAIRALQIVSGIRSN